MSSRQKKTIQKFTIIKRERFQTDKSRRFAIQWSRYELGLEKNGRMVRISVKSYDNGM